MVCPSIAADPEMAVWRADAVRRGYASLAAFPLLNGDQAIGALLIYSSVPDAFETGDVGLLAEVASDLTFGVFAIRTRAALQLSEERYALVSDAANDSVWDWTIETDEVYHSTRVREVLGCAPDAVPRTSRAFFQSVVPDHRDQVQDRKSTRLNSSHT